MEEQEFLPLFSQENGRRPGFRMEMEYDCITFKSAKINGRSCNLSRRFESSYDWSKVMKMFLESVQTFTDVHSAEDKAREKLGEWFNTYAGWGLVTSMLPTPLHNLYTQKLRLIKRDWSQHEESTDEACWRVFRANCSDFDHVISEYEIFINNNAADNTGRSKILTLRLVYQ